MRRLGAIGLAAVLLSACGGAASPAYIPRPLVTSGPYVVTAIDYHFHDAHPTQPLGLDRTLVIHNDSVHIHNVTIPGTGFSKDVAPGHRLVIHLGTVFSEPGDYAFFCKYHVDRGMGGLIVVT
jgi:Cupredoxin-like domain